MSGLFRGAVGLALQRCSSDCGSAADAVWGTRERLESSSSCCKASQVNEVQEGDKNYICIKEVKIRQQR